MGGPALAKAEDWKLGENVPKNEVMAEFWHLQSWSSRTWVLEKEGLLLSSSLGEKTRNSNHASAGAGAFVRDHIDAWLWALLQVGNLFHKHFEVCWNVFLTFINIFSNELSVSARQIRCLLPSSSIMGNCFADTMQKMETRLSAGLRAQTALQSVVLWLACCCMEWGEIMMTTFGQTVSIV